MAEKIITKEILTQKVFKYTVLVEHKVIWVIISCQEVGRLLMIFENFFLFYF